MEHGAWYNVRVVTKRRNTEIHSNELSKLTWVYVTKNDQKTLDTLRRRFEFEKIDLKETKPPLQRPKLVARNDYLFMILLYPVLDKKTGIVQTAEVDFFIRDNLLVTMNANRMKQLESLYTSCSKVPIRKKKAVKKTNYSRHGSGNANVCIDGDITHVIYRILDELLDSIFPMVIELSDQITNIEKRMFTEYDKNLIQELLRVKTNIVSVRKSIQGHKNVIRQLIGESEGRFPIHRLEAYFQRLVEHTKELWDTLEIQRDTIDALHETNASLIDFRINQIMKTLTIFSVIVFPLTLLAALFGMNTRSMPLVDLENGFWIILAVMGIGTLGMLFLFKRKKWL